MSDRNTSVGGGRHTIQAADVEERERIITEFLNHFEVIEETDDVIVLKRRTVTFEEASEREHTRFAASWRGWVTNFFLGVFDTTMEKCAKNPWAKHQAPDLPAGTEHIEIRLKERRSGN